MVQLLLEHAPSSPLYKNHGVDGKILLALAVAHGSTDVVALLLDPLPSTEAVLRGVALPPPRRALRREPSSVLEGAGDDYSRDASEDGGIGCLVAPPPTELWVQPWALDMLLHLAIRKGHLGMCRLLVGAGASSLQQWQGGGGGGLQAWGSPLQTLLWAGRWVLAEQGACRRLRAAGRGTRRFHCNGMHPSALLRFLLPARPVSCRLPACLPCSFPELHDIGRVDCWQPPGTLALQTGQLEIAAVSERGELRPHLACMSVRPPA